MILYKDRCPWAIKYGMTLHTRCGLPADHESPLHVGSGLAVFPYQRIDWLRGDSREYLTDRTDQYSWEEK